MDAVGKCGRGYSILEVTLAASLDTSLPAPMNLHPPADVEEACVVTLPCLPPCACPLPTQDMCDFVNLAHTFGMGVMMDVVLHHGAPAANNLWDYDGW